MTTLFKGTPKFTGISGDHAHVTALGDLVLIRSVDVMAEQVVTIAMTPKQARYLVDGILSSVVTAEAFQ